MLFLHDLKNSVLSFPFYKEVAARPLSQAMKFLVKLVLLMTIILSVRLSFDAYRWIETMAHWMIQSVPEITVTNGKAHSDIQQPYQVEASGKNFVFILDTTGTIQDIPKEYPSGILVMLEKIVFKENTFQKREYPLTQLSGLVINQQTVESLKKTLKGLAVPVITIGLFLYFFVARILQVLFFSLISFVINLSGGMGLGYTALFNIGVYALVPCSLLGALVGVIGIALLWFPVVYSSSYLAYLMIGVLQSKK